MNVMSATPQEVIEAALKLSADEREFVVEELSASLSPRFASAEVEKAWADEIDRRDAEIASGKDVLEEWPAARDEVLADLRRKY